MNPYLTSLDYVRLDFLGLDSELALYSLLLISAGTLLTIRRMNLSWSWPLIVKVALLVTAIILGLTIGPRSIYANISWSLFIVLFMLPAFLSKLCLKQMSNLNSHQALDLARFLRWLYWGKSGQFFYDSVNAFYLYSLGEKTKAEILLDKWSQEKIPVAYSDQLINSRLLGYILLRDWQRVIQEYDLYKKGGAPGGGQPYAYASRAYIELEKLNEAAECLASEKPPRSKNEAAMLALSLFLFFCAAGLADEANQVQEMMTKYRYGLPDATKYFWLARLALIQQDYAQSAILLERANKNASPIWRSRIEMYKKIVEEKIKSANEKQKENDVLASIDPKNLEQVKQSWRQLRAFMYAQEIASPTNQSKAVSFLVSTILIVFLVSNVCFLLPNKFTELISFTCYGGGALILKEFLSGEYWRLFTYMFLHVNLLHALVNLMALYFFGSMVAKIYNEGNFLLIYFVSGLIGGLCQVIFYPGLPCVGASGAIMGVFGAAIAGIFRLRKLLPPFLAKRQLRWMGIILLVQVIMDQIIPHIGVSAHLGGLLAGMALGLLLPISNSINREINVA